MIGQGRVKFCPTPVSTPDPGKYLSYGCGSGSEHIILLALTPALEIFRLPRLRFRKFASLSPGLGTPRFRESPLTVRDMKKAKVSSRPRVNVNSTFELPIMYFSDVMIPEGTQQQVSRVPSPRRNYVCADCILMLIIFIDIFCLVYIHQTLVLGCLSNAMEQNSSSRGFIISGFPRSLEQLERFEMEVGCSAWTGLAALLGRQQGLVCAYNVNFWRLDSPSELNSLLIRQDLSRAPLMEGGEGGWQKEPSQIISEAKRRSETDQAPFESCRQGQPFPA